MLLRVENPGWQLVVDVALSVCVGLLFAIFLLGLLISTAQAQTPPPVDASTLVGFDPLTAMIAKLGGAGSLIYVLLAGAKKHVPFLNAGTARSGLFLYLSALALGAVFGLAGIVEPMPGNAIIGALASGLGAGTFAVTFHAGKRVIDDVRAESRTSVDEEAT